VGVPKGEREGQRIFEKIMAENFPNLARDINLQIQEAEETPSRINRKKSMPMHIVKLLKMKGKEKSSKHQREIKNKDSPKDITLQYNEIQ